MKKKDYEKPTMQVVKLQHVPQLLQGSQVGAKSDIKDWENEEVTQESIYF
ncbi:MAG: hypothetical protein J5720_07310 [Bacteroidaceae bacterium]|nr:hypothetical protein [Bacteroidaceae bacterium]